MKNKAIILGTIWVSLLTLSSFASADFDCSTIGRDEIKTLMDKQKAWTTLTDDETTLLENAESCRPANSWSGMMDRGWKWWMMSWSWMTEEQKAKMDSIKTILEKQKAGETLTDEEQESLDEFNKDKPEMWSWALAWTGKTTWEKTNKKSSNTTTSTAKVSDAYKTKIDKKVKSMISSSSLTNSDKIETLESFLEKITTIQKSINSSSYSETKKQTYNSLINYFIESINSSISDLKTWTNDSNIDSLINEVFWE